MEIAQIKRVFNSPLKNSLIRLIFKRIRSIPVWEIVNIITNSKTDEEIYDKFRDLFTKRVSRSESWSEWGKSISDLSVTERAKSRIIEIQLAIPNPPPQSYLDIGGGNCEIAYGIAKTLNLQKDSTFVIDIDDFCTTLLKKQLTYACCKQDEPIKLGAGSVDLITAFQTLHHMRDLTLKLHEIHRILTPRGVFIIREHDCGGENMSALIDIEHTIYDVVIFGKSYKKVRESYFGKYRSRQAWTVLLEKVGFTFERYLPTANRNNPSSYYYGVYTKK